MSVKRYNPDIRKSTSKPFLLYIFIVPFLLSVVVALFAMNIKAFILNCAIFLLYMGVLYLSNRGFKNEEEYNKKILTKAPKIPYKLLSALLLGIVVFSTSYIISEQSILKSSFLSIISILGYYLYYGFDPREDKLPNIDGVSQEFVLETLQDATQKIEFIEKSLSGIDKPSLKDKIENAINTAYKIINTIQKDPQDIRVARKFLIVYLDEIKTLIISYKDIDSEYISEDTHNKLEDLFDDIQDRFEKELIRLKENNILDLDINIDTLKIQINN
jgi:5-bromo-4-chloroindolyl phosphate hydrolysis protein